MDPLKLWLTGTWRELGELRRELARLDGVKVLSSSGSRAGVGVIVHATTGAEVPLDELAALRRRSDAPVVLLAGAFAPGLVEAAAAADVADVLIQPQVADAVAFAALKAFAAAGERARPADSGLGRVITVFSPKGGTGKSALSCNLAVALAQSGRRTLLVDLDLQFGDTAIMLGLEPERTLHDLLAAPGALDAEKIAGYAMRHASGVEVLQAPVRPEEGELVSDARVAELLDAARSAYDAVVVDSPPFFSGPLLVALDRSDPLLLVCVPDVPTLKNVRLTLQTLELLSFPPERLRLVLNRANPRVGLQPGQVTAVLERSIDVELPEDESVGFGVNCGTPAVLLRRESPYALAVGKLPQLLATTAGAAPVTAPRRRFPFAVGRRA